MLGWCIGGTLSLMHCGLDPDTPVRNLLLLTTPVDTSGSLYFNWTARDSFDVDHVAEVYGAVPGRQIDWANKLMKPVTNYWTTYRRLWQQIYEGEGAFKPDAYQAMAKWVADNPPFPGRRTASGSPSCTRRTGSSAASHAPARPARRPAATSTRTSWSSPPAPTTSRPATGTLPLLDMVGSEDVTHFDRPGGHIGLMAGSRARKEIWPDLAEWLGERSDR